MKIIQLAHGKIIPSYTSAYSMRCHNYISSLEGRQLLSVSGLVFRDKNEDYAKQYRSFLTFIYSIFKKNRSLEYHISTGKFLRGKYRRDAIKAINEAEIVVFEGPWQYYLFSDFLNSKIVVYDAHNVESELRKGNPYESFTKKLESDVLNRADVTITVTEDDYNTFRDDFGVPQKKLVCIPEGFRTVGGKWKGKNSNDIVFIGSAYSPNIEAVDKIFDFARRLPNFKFKVIGTVCSAIKKQKLPDNVILLGEIDDSEKNSVFSNSLLAINPVVQGSGRNLKMNDYVSHGIPILTTNVGSRGFDNELVDHFRISELDKFVDEIQHMSNNRNLLENISSFFIEYAKINDYEKTKEAAKAIFTKLSESSGLHSQM